MPTIDDYALLAPFTLDELVAAVNAILRERPSLQIQGRTVRFYISNGLLPSPSGGPKYARYGMEHLRRLVAIRRWLDLGMSLEQAADRIKLGEHGGDTATHQRKPGARMFDRLSSPSGQKQTLTERTVRRIYLTDRSVLEVDSSADLPRELERASEAIRREIDRL